MVENMIIYVCSTEETFSIKCDANSSDLLENLEDHGQMKTSTVWVLLY